MTTMTMNAGYATANRRQPARITFPLHQLAEAGQALVPGIEWCQDRLLELAGGVLLALVPFSMLAWMFIAL